MVDLNTPDNCLFFYRVRQVLLRILTVHVYCKLANVMAVLNILQKSEHCTFSRMMHLIIQEKVVRYDKIASYKKDVIFFTSIPPLVIEESWQNVCRGRTGPKLKQL
jgi:hypothetical protein